MTLKAIIRRYEIERDVFFARVHGRIVGASDDGFDDRCMPDSIRFHKASRVRAAWWSGFTAAATQYCIERNIITAPSHDTDELPSDQRP